MTCSLLIAHNFETADQVAVSSWRWERHSEAFGRYEYRRPDRPREAIRWLPDRRDALHGLRWNTMVYLVEGWQRRDTAAHVQYCLDSGFFKAEDPELLPPRRKPARDAELAEVRRTLARLEQRK
jgi:hypothetical protein